MLKSMLVRNQKGFTLFEILIVLTIIAVMSGVIVLNVRAPSYSKFMATAQKAASTLEVIGDYAVYTNSVIVCDLKNGISCEIYKDFEWSVLPLTKVVTWKWPDELVISQLYVNGVKLKSDWKIRFLPTGDPLPVSIQITDERFTTWIDSNVSGEFTVSN